MTVQLQRYSARRVAEQQPALVELLLDAVHSGASVEFVPPLLPDVARAHWQRVAEALAHGSRELVVAERQGALLGAVQLLLASQANARHRAEVRELLVHSTARRQGLGRLLLGEVEELARAHGRSLLVLEAREGEAEPFLLGLGYLKAGRIPGFARGLSGALEAAAIFYRPLPGG